MAFCVEVNDVSVAVVALIQERCKTLLDVVEQTRFFFSDVQGYDAAAVKKWVKPVTPKLLQALIDKFDGLSDWQSKSIHAAVQAVVDEQEVGFAKVAQPVRIAITGNTVSPSIDQTLAMLGREVSMTRLRAGAAQFVVELSKRETP